MLICLTCSTWGYSSIDLSNSQKKILAQAASNQVSYDLGFKKVLGYTEVKNWMKAFDAYLLTGDLSKFGNKNCGTQKYTHRIEVANPGYLANLWRYAINTIGPKGTFSKLTHVMNLKSCVRSDPCPELHLDV